MATLAALLNKHKNARKSLQDARDAVIEAEKRVSDVLGELKDAAKEEGLDGVFGVKSSGKGKRGKRTGPSVKSLCLTYLKKHSEGAETDKIVSGIGLGEDRKGGVVATLSANKDLFESLGRGMGYKLTAEGKKAAAELDA